MKSAYFDGDQTIESHLEYLKVWFINTLLEFIQIFIFSLFTFKLYNTVLDKFQNEKKVFGKTDQNFNLFMSKVKMLRNLMIVYSAFHTF
jgi:hypothetical protein